MAYSSFPLALPSPSSTPKWKYDVFLNFRGEDTRKNFVSHLYAALHQKSIITFKDDCELEGGKTISIETLKAIKHSKILVVIFSKNYASSTWCLDELVEISECLKPAEEQTVLPVFYHVDPSEVRRQTGKYLEFFGKHEKTYKRNMKKVQRWKSALTQVTSLAGWDIQDRHESEAIQEIVDRISIELRKSSDKLSIATSNFVGMDSRVQELSLYLDFGQSNDVRFIGICGMGGIGKTTLARIVYENFSSEFEGKSFIADVREAQNKHGLVPLQEQLLSQILMRKNTTVVDSFDGINSIKKMLCHKKVLIILDDVNQMEQLKSLVGMRSWFGKGSRIIVTSRDEHLLISHGVDKIYRVKSLNHVEAFHLFCLKAFHLFCLKAFKNVNYEDDYLELANHFVDYANGLPLAIDILGSFLFGRSVNEWRSALERLKEIPNKEIMEKLYISFDGLEETEKKIFLDIACFFKGEEEEYVKRVLRSCGLYPDIGLRVLMDKSLITVPNGRVWIHDLLQDMGRQIVRQECNDEPGRQSRLWLYKDISWVMLNDTGSEQVEGIVLDSYQQEDEILSAKAFTKMKRLRLLKLRGFQFSQGGLDYLSNELRYLEWHGYPFNSFPSTFHPNKILELHLHHSNLQHLWRGAKAMKLLKIIDLRHSENLVKIMDFRDVPNLEELNLEGCTKLVEVHESIGVLRILRVLNLKNCKSLKKIPNSICQIKSLKVLNMHGCSKIVKLPESLGEMKCLENLLVGGIGTENSSWNRTLDFLFSLWFSPRKRPNPLDLVLPSLSFMSSLKTLDLRYCNLKEGMIPNDLSCFPLLDSLNLEGNDIETLPGSINQLTKLFDLGLANCKKLQSIPELPSSLSMLNLDGCSSFGTSVSRSVSRDFRIQNLFVANCYRLSYLYASSIIHLRVDGFVSPKKPSHPFGDSPLEQLSLMFVKRLKLTEIQGIKSTTFARLTNYLHYLIKHCGQGFFNPSTQVTVCLSGNEVPTWFSCRRSGSSLQTKLPPHWCTNTWLGFAISAVIGSDKIPSETCTISCDLQLTIAPNQRLFLGRTSTQISGRDMCISSDQLWFTLMAKTSLKSLDWSDLHGQLEASFFSDQLMVKIKFCGFKIVYYTLINEFVQCDISYDDDVVIKCDTMMIMDKGKRSRDDYSHGNGLEVDENGNDVEHERFCKHSKSSH